MELRSEAWYAMGGSGGMPLNQMQTTPTFVVQVVAFTALTTAIVGLLVNRFGNKILDLVARPVRRLCAWLYAKFVWRFPQMALRSYRRSVLKSSLARLETPLGGVEVSLSEAFAPLKLVEPGEPEAVDLFAFVASVRRAVVLGGAGTGKTTLMKSLVTSVLEQRCPPQLSGCIPVFVVLRRLVAAQPQSVEGAIVAAFAEHHYPNAGAFVRALLGDGQMIVILDGLDEVGVDRDLVLGHIRQFCEHDRQRDTPNRVFVTCREQSYRDRPLATACPREVRVEPFSNHHMKIFLHGWPPTKNRRASDLYRQLENEPTVRDACRNPLFLTLLTGLFLQKQDFSLPASRDDFYRLALNELLVERPARNQIKQLRTEEEKRSILEAAVVERLMDVGAKDPEELPRAVLEKHAAKILPDKSSAAQLLAELVEVNGLLKRIDERSFTLAHRTLHEYLAAKVAAREFEPPEVLATFGVRDDLFEVVVFYCGVLTNVPQLNQVLQHYVDAGHWVKAARCILHASCVPHHTLVAATAAGLRSELGTRTIAESLGLLSSLAQRSGNTFTSARHNFTAAIDGLVGQLRGHDAGALVSALGATPEQAVQVVPALLRSGSPSWQQAALDLLRDIGTDDAVAQLLRVAEGDDEAQRVRAALILAELMRTRPDELKRLGTAWAGQGDPSVWPLDARFPGKIALIIARALQNGPASGHAAIDLARLVLRARGGAELGAEEQSELRNWKTFQRDARLQGIWRYCGLVLGASILVIWSAVSIVLVGITVANHVRNGAVVVEMPSLDAATLDFAALSDRAAELETIVDESYPPNATGAARLLPWNWSVEPELSGRAREVYDQIYTLARAERQPVDALEAMAAIDEGAMSAVIAPEAIGRALFTGSADVVPDPLLGPVQFSSSGVNRENSKTWPASSGPLESVAATFTEELRKMRDHRAVRWSRALGVGQLSGWEWVLVALGLFCEVSYGFVLVSEYPTAKWRRGEMSTFDSSFAAYLAIVGTAIFSWPLLVDAWAGFVVAVPTLFFGLAWAVLAWSQRDFPRNPLVRRVLNAFDHAAAHVSATPRSTPPAAEQPGEPGTA
jgi:hypothetical protein